MLVRFDCLKLPGNKKLYLFFEVHAPLSNCDRQQLEILSKILVLRDRLRLPTMHLMVEVPSWLAQERALGSKVTYDFLERVAHCPSIVAEDIENRCISLAAYYLLGLSKRESEDASCAREQYNAGPRWYTTGDITVGMLLEEFSTQKA